MVCSLWVKTQSDSSCLHRGVISRLYTRRRRKGPPGASTTPTSLSPLRAAESVSPLYLVLQSGVDLSPFGQDIGSRSSPFSGFQFGGHPCLQTFVGCLFFFFTGILLCNDGGDYQLPLRGPYSQQKRRVVGVELWSSFSLLL